jgi:hypothetical protein
VEAEPALDREVRVQRHQQLGQHGERAHARDYHASAMGSG